MSVVALGPLAEGCACCGADVHEPVHHRQPSPQLSVWDDEPEPRRSTVAELRKALAARKHAIDQLLPRATVDQVKGEVTLTREDHDRIKAAMNEARQIRELLDLAVQAEELAEPRDVERIEIMTMESAHPIRVIEVDRTPPPPPAPIPPEVWAQAELNRAIAEQERAEAEAIAKRAAWLAAVRDECHAAADSFDEWAFAHRADPVPRWYRWVFPRGFVAQLDAEYAAGLRREEARHVLAGQLRDTADLPDDVLEWLLAEGWRPPAPEQWLYLD